jgi:hypothetical protein
MRSGALQTWGMPVGKLFTYRGQPSDFYTTVAFSRRQSVGKLVGFTSSFRYFSEAFPTIGKCFLSLLLSYLYPLSTPPITTSIKL